MEQVTAAQVWREGSMTEDSRRKINKSILLCHHLSTLQDNLFKDIELELRKCGDFKLEVKHNHGRIKALMDKQRLKLDNVWMNATEEQIECFCHDAEELERIVREWGNL